MSTVINANSKKAACLQVDDTGQLLVSGSGGGASVTVTRPANTTAYVTNDVVGGVITFTDMGPTGRRILLTSAALRYDVGSVPAGMANFRLHLYSVTPPSALADNAAWDLSAGDRAGYVGFIDLGTPADFGSTLFTQVNNLGMQTRLDAADTRLFGYLVTTAGYTPAANSETFNIRLRSVGL